MCNISPKIKHTAFIIFEKYYIFSIYYSKTEITTMKAFKDLKVGDKIYKFNPDTYEITWKVITDIKTNLGWGKHVYVFAFDGKLDRAQPNRDFFRLEDWEANESVIDDGWAIADINVFFQYCKADFEEMKRSYMENVKRYEKSINILSEYIRENNLLEEEIEKE